MEGKMVGGGKMMDRVPETALAGSHLYYDPGARQGEVQAMKGLRYLIGTWGHSLFLYFGIRVRVLLHGVK